MTGIATHIYITTMSLLIKDTTREERIAFLRERFRCLADCDLCGNCILLHHRDAEDVYADYIDGLRPFADITRELRNR